MTGHIAPASARPVGLSPFAHCILLHAFFWLCPPNPSAKHPPPPRELNALVKTVNLQNADAVLTKARALAMQVEVPDRVIEDLGRGMADAGIIVPGSPERWQQALAALKVLCHT